MLTRLTNKEAAELETIAEMLDEWTRNSLRSDDPRKPECFQIVEDLQSFAFNQTLRIWRG